MKLRSFLFILIAAAAFASCKKSNTQGRLIPDAAFIVIHIDGKSVLDKLPWSEIKNNPLLQDALSDSTVPAFVKKILDNPENSGVDVKNDLLFFLQKDSTGGYAAFEGNIKDEAAFKTFCSSITENGSASERNGVNYISHFPYCAGWNKEKFVFVFDVPQLSRMDALSKRMQNDSINISPAKPRDIGKTCEAVFSLEEKQSLADDARFSKLVKETGDVHFWMNSEEFYKGNEMPSALAILNLEKLYKGSISAATLNFDNGKIKMKASSYGGEEMIKLYKKYGGGKVNEDMLKRIPGKEVLGAVALNFKPEGLREVLKLLNLDGLINMGAASIGFTLDDFVKANKGDIVVGVSDFKLTPDTSAGLPGEDGFSPSPMPKPDFNFIIAASIGDKDAFNKLIAAGKKLGANFGSSETFKPGYNSNGTYFAFGNTQQNADAYLSSKGSNFDFIDKISGEAFGGYINLQSLIKIFETEAAKDSSAKVIYDASLKLWDNAYAKGGKFSDDAIQQEGEINLVDKNTNSLKQLNQYFSVIGTIVKEKEKKQKEDMMAFEDAVTPGSSKDSAAAVPGK